MHEGTAVGGLLEWRRQWRPWLRYFLDGLGGGPDRPLVTVESSDSRRPVDGTFFTFASRTGAGGSSRPATHRP